MANYVLFLKEEEEEGNSLFKSSPTSVPASAAVAAACRGRQRERTRERGGGVR